MPSLTPQRKKKVKKKDYRVCSFDGGRHLLAFMHKEGIGCLYCGKIFPYLDKPMTPLQRKKVKKIRIQFSITRTNISIKSLTAGYVANWDGTMQFAGTPEGQYIVAITKKSP